MPAFQFNSQGVDPQYGGMGGLPLGKHPVVIVGTELKPTKDNSGGYLEIKMEAIDGPSKGGTTVDRLNLHNKSEVAVKIANQQLSAYCHVTGVFAFNATEELHGKPFVVEMVPRTGADAREGQTEVGKLYDINGNEPGKAGSGPSGGGNAFGNTGGAVPPLPSTDQGQGQGSGGPSWAGAGQQQGGGATATGGGWNQGQGGGAGGPWGQK